MRSKATLIAIGACAISLMIVLASKPEIVMGPVTDPVEMRPAPHTGAPAAPSFTLRGVIVDQNAQPLPDWTVRGTRDSVESSETGAFVLHNEPATVTLRFSPPGSDTHRTIVITDGPNWRPPEVSEGPRVRYPLFYTDPFASSDKELRFVLPFVRNVRGRFVSTQTGEPLSGVKYKLGTGAEWDAAAPGDPVIRFAWSVGDDASSLSSGTFTIPIAPVGKYYIEVKGAGVVAGAHRIEIAPDTRNLGDMPLDVGAILRARLVDSEGRPFPTGSAPFIGVSVTRGKTVVERDWMRLSVDTDGLVGAVGFPLDAFRISLTCDDFISVGIDDLPELRSGKVADLGDITVRRGATLVGRFVDPETGNPVPLKEGPCDVKVYVRFRDSRHYKCFILDASLPGERSSGRFEIKPLREDAVEMRFTSDDSDFHTITSPVYDPNGVTDMGDIPFPSGRGFRGRFIDSHGRPVRPAMAAVSALMPDGAPTYTQPVDVAEGGILKGRHIPECVSEVTVWCAGFLPTTVTVPRARADGVDLGDIPLERGESVRCSIVSSESGEPVKGVIVAQSVEVPFSFDRFPWNHTAGVPDGLVRGLHTQVGRPADTAARRWGWGASEVIVTGLPSGETRLLLYRTSGGAHVHWWHQTPIENTVQIISGETAELRIEVP